VTPCAATCLSTCAILLSRPVQHVLAYRSLRTCFGDNGNGGPGAHPLSRSADGRSGAAACNSTCTVTRLAGIYGRSRTEANECHEAGGLPAGARLLVLARRSVSEGGRLSWCTSGWT
jgi:hypothetical protein